MGILGRSDINSNPTHSQIYFLSSSGIKRVDLDHVLSALCSEIHLAENILGCLLSVFSSTSLAPELCCPKSLLQFEVITLLTKRLSSGYCKRKSRPSLKKTVSVILYLANICMVSGFDTAGQSLSWIDTAHLQKRSCNLVEEHSSRCK